MRSLLSSPWIFRAWVAWILFSQTAVAGTLADRVFALFFDPQPGPVDWTHFVAQKGYHVLLFSVLGVLLGRRDKAPALAWCIGLGVFAECLQMLSANRHPSPWDALLNVLRSACRLRVEPARARPGLTVEVTRRPSRAGAPDSRQRSAPPLRG